METTPHNNNNSVSGKGEGFIDIDVKKLFYACAGLFVISSLGVLLSHILPFLAFAMYLWYVAVGVSLISVVKLFFTGIYQGFSGKSFNLVGAAVVFLVILGLIGFGTCALNMSGL